MFKTSFRLVVLALMSFNAGTAAADDNRDQYHQRWWQGEWQEEFRDGSCEVRIESQRGEFKREVKCKDGIGARWTGVWKTEFREGRCLVKQEAKRDEFKEEVKCSD